MIWRCVILTLFLQTFAMAQVDDLADDPWNIPQLDALQMYTADPICLRCVKPSELTSLPGIGRRTAAAIVRAVQNGAESTQAIADKACLSVDQFVIIAATTTLNCTCGSWFTSASMRSRNVSSPGTAPSQQGRLDIRTSNLRAGGLYRSGTSGALLGGWAEVDLAPVTILAGDLSMRTGLGLVHGGGGSFGRGPMSRARSATSAIRMRPWTSSWQESSQRGIGVHVADSIAGHSLEGGGYWSQRWVSDRQETSVSAAISVGLSESIIGATLQHLAYDRQSESRSSAVISTIQRTLASVHGAWNSGTVGVHAEVAADDSLRLAMASTVQVGLANGRVIGAMRWMHPDMRNPYAAPISSRSTAGNEAGILIGWQQRMAPWTIEASLDVHRILSRSFGRPLPSSGMDLLVDIDRRLSSQISVSTRVRYETDREGWRPPDSSITIMTQRHRATIRGELVVKPLPTLRVRLRGDIRSLSFDRWRPSEIGSLIYLDARWTPSPTLTFTGRCTVFRSPSIESAPYTLEVPIAGFLRTVAGSGEGVRLYGAVRYQPVPWLAISSVLVRQTKLPEYGQLSGAFQVELLVK